MSTSEAVLAANAPEALRNEVRCIFPSSPTMAPETSDKVHVGGRRLLSPLDQLTAQHSCGGRLHHLKATWQRRRSHETRDFRFWAGSFDAEDMPMSEQLDSLRQAAMTLLTAAPAGAVLKAVRTLLDGLELDRPPSQPATVQSAATGPVQATLTTNVQVAVPAQNADGLAEWERLRQQIRAARQARGITLRILADELGLKASTVESALQTRRPASLRLQHQLTDWLAASEVAATPAEPFLRAAEHGPAAGDGAEQLGAR
jgi:hypothetical protein